MPTLEKHIELSLKRTGKPYKEIHEWLDGKNLSYKEKIIRHNTTNIQKFLPIIEKQFGKDSVKEYLQHLKDDYNSSLFLKLLEKSRKIKFW